VTGWRSAAELRDVASPAWPAIAAQVAAAPVEVDVVRVDEIARVAALEALQVTTRSALGALVSECGVVRVDHGWLRILGAGERVGPPVGDLTWLLEWATATS
jgi:hypothetical protein